MTTLATLVATWFYSGLIRPAPGTWGTLAGMPFAWAILTWADWRWLLGGAIVLTLVGGMATARYMTAKDRTSDPQEVVVDEVAGVWIACAALPEPDLLWLLAGFLLFRLFDIWKPGPVGWADRRLKGAPGVMADDLIAGAFAAIVLLLTRFAMGI